MYIPSLLDCGGARCFSLHLRAKVGGQYGLVNKEFDFQKQNPIEIMQWCNENFAEPNPEENRFLITALFHYSHNGGTFDENAERHLQTLEAEGALYSVSCRPLSMLLLLLKNFSFRGIPLEKTSRRKRLLISICNEAKTKILLANAREIANLLTGLVYWKDSELLNILCKQIEWKIEAFSVSELGKTLKALAKLDHYDEPAVDALIKAALRYESKDFTPANAAIILQALARFKVSTPHALKLATLLQKTVTTKANTLNSFHAALCVTGLCHYNLVDEKLLDTLCRNNVSAFSIEGIASVMKALAFQLKKSAADGAVLEISPTFLLMLETLYNRCDRITALDLPFAMQGMEIAVDAIGRSVSSVSSASQGYVEDPGFHELIGVVVDALGGQLVKCSTIAFTWQETFKLLVAFAQCSRVSCMWKKGQQFDLLCQTVQRWIVTLRASEVVQVWSLFALIVNTQEQDNASDVTEDFLYTWRRGQRPSLEALLQESLIRRATAKVDELNARELSKMITAVAQLNFNEQGSSHLLDCLLESAVGKLSTPHADKHAFTLEQLASILTWSQRSSEMGTQVSIKALPLLCWRLCELVLRDCTEGSPPPVALTMAFQSLANSRGFTILPADVLECLCQAALRNQVAWSVPSHIAITLDALAALSNSGPGLNKKFQNDALVSMLVVQATQQASAFGIQWMSQALTSVSSLVDTRIGTDLARVFCKTVQDRVASAKKSTSDEELDRLDAALKPFKLAIKLPQN